MLIYTYKFTWDLSLLKIERLQQELKINSALVGINCLSQNIRRQKQTSVVTQHTEKDTRFKYFGNTSPRGVKRWAAERLSVAVFAYILRRLAIILKLWNYTNHELMNVIRTLFHAFRHNGYMVLTIYIQKPISL